ncbi:MAG: acyltransferase family protein, partial [Lachnospiraceae bacterium]|nr:acyltransferase family protein [Lachnospiraceae bacterium]
MKYKKPLMGLAALLILTFHFYIPIWGTEAETFFVRTAYIGVDMFFLLSAMSLGKRDSCEWKSFYLNRLSSVYLPYLSMAVIAWIYHSWSISRFLSVVTGLEFLKRGGGAFLWFIPGILLLYALTPLLYKLRQHMGNMSAWIPLGIWALLGVLLEYVFGYKKLMILVNRIPIFIIGFYLPEMKILPDKKTRSEGELRAGQETEGTGVRSWVLWLAAMGGLAAGSLLLWKFGTLSRLNIPWSDFYYVAAIPSVLSLTLLMKLITEAIPEKWPVKLPVLGSLGDLTLEIYGLQ